MAVAGADGRRDRGDADRTILPRGGRDRPRHCAGPHPDDHRVGLRAGPGPTPIFGSYIPAAEPPAEPLASPSRVFPDGGAWLKETSADRRSLSAALWNSKVDADGHAHKETNVLCLAAYGEFLLRNSGYSGWSTPEQGFSWEYIHDRAIAGNVALFDYAVPRTPEQERLPPAENAHQQRSGAGVVASLLTGGIDFARGDLGDAIPNGRHTRDLLFVHPADGAGGYYIVFDTLSSRSAATGQIVWHANAERCVVDLDAHEYLWTTDEFGGAEGSLTIFLATPSTDPTLHDGILANWGRGVVGKYLVAPYPLDGDGQCRVMTVLFPHDASHPKAAFGRGHAVNGGAATVTQGDLCDALFFGDGASEPTRAAQWSARAAAGVVRSDASHVIAVWLNRARGFESDAFAFASELPITLYFKGGVLHARTEQAVALTCRRGGGPAVQMQLSAGMNRFELPKIPRP